MDNLDPRRPLLAALGKRIRDERSRKGMCQTDLAHALRVSTACISLFERGDRNPPYTKVLQIANALAVDPSRLFEP